MPARVRPAIKALWDLDLAFADVVATSSDPNLGAIRLAWWRERLEDLDRGGSPPAEPRLQAVAAELLPHGVTGDELSDLEDAWLPLLQPFPWSGDQANGLRLRGRILFAIGAWLLGGQPEKVEAAGELWSLRDGAERCTDENSRETLLAEMGSLCSEVVPVPPGLRSLTLPAALAAQDAIGSPGAIRRGIAALCHRYRGTFPR